MFSVLKLQSQTLLVYREEARCLQTDFSAESRTGPVTLGHNPRDLGEPYLIVYLSHTGAHTLMCVIGDSVRFDVCRNRARACRQHEKARKHS